MLEQNMSPNVSFSSPFRGATKCIQGNKGRYSTKTWGHWRKIKEKSGSISEENVAGKPENQLRGRKTLRKSVKIQIRRT